MALPPTADRRTPPTPTPLPEAAPAPPGTAAGEGTLSADRFRRLTDALGAFWRTKKRTLTDDEWTQLYVEAMKR